MQMNGTSEVPDLTGSPSAEKIKDPIAIVGIGCRYPGASNVEELWQNLLTGTDSIGSYPSSRFSRSRQGL
jgi:acyl transferase domain-containing protein